MGQLCSTTNDQVCSGDNKQKQINSENINKSFTIDTPTQKTEEKLEIINKEREPSYSFGSENELNEYIKGLKNIKKQ
jgi:hypothetical protein